VVTVAIVTSDNDGDALIGMVCQHFSEGGGSKAKAKPLKQWDKHKPAPTLKEKENEMKCKRCDQDIETNAPPNVVICGSCADDLRQEEEAMITQLEAESINDQMDKEAYEEEMQRQESEYRFL